MLPRLQLFTSSLVIVGLMLFWTARAHLDQLALHAIARDIHEAKKQGQIQGHRDPIKRRQGEGFAHHTTSGHGQPNSAPRILNKDVALEGIHRRAPKRFGSGERESCPETEDMEDDEALDELDDVSIAAGCRPSVMASAVIGGALLVFLSVYS